MVSGLTLRQTKRLLWATAACAGAIALTLLIATWLMPYSLPEAGFADATQRRVAANKHDPRLAIDDFALLWSLDLHRPLYDPPPPEVKTVKFVPPPLKVKLVGTVIEEPESQAMVLDGRGDVVFLRIGDTVDNARIVSISDRDVVLHYYDQQITLSMDPRN